MLEKNPGNYSHRQEGKMVGNISIYLSLTAALAAAALFFVNCFKERTQVLKAARFFFYLHTLGVALSSFYLLYALLTHKFEYYYVYAHTERALPLKFLISAFWAGQEGSYLLWALFGAVIGVVVMKRERRFESPVMGFLSAAQSFLLIFLAVESPFRLLRQVPADGAGLNPLLQDPWMAIHPPVVFLGYSLLIVPYALALAGLWRREYQKWLTRALPWALMGWGALGAGIFIGGYWAYRVLGWGGYWSWDPVENASLVIWLTASAMVHAYLVQKRGQRPLSSVFLLSIITFILVLYATFLTRSGVLADFSVHSFAQTPLTNYLLFFMLFFLGTGLTLYLLRYREIRASQDSEKEKGVSRSNLILWGVYALLLSAIFIALGTSSPVLTALWGAPASVDQSFYITTNFPLAIALCLLLVAIPFVSWRREPAAEIFKRAMPFGVGAAVAVAAAAARGIFSAGNLLFIAAAVFALIFSLYDLYLCLRKRSLKFCGAPLAHTGVVLLLIGVIASLGYARSQIAALSEGAPQQALGYTLTYEGKLLDEETGGEIFEINLFDGKRSFKATPRIYFAGAEPRLMREPYIRRYLHGDLYLSPLEVQRKKGGIVAGFAAGESRVVRGMQVTFLGFEIPEGGEVIGVEALLEVSFGGETVILTPRLYIGGEERFQEPSPTPDGGEVILEAVHAEEKIAHLRFISPFEEEATREIIFIELTFNPLILSLVLGTFLITFGIALAAWRRFAER